MRFLCQLLALALAFPLSVSAQFEFNPKSHLVPSLIADTTTVAPGKSFTVGIVVKMDAGWHTYWEFAGDAGLPFTAKWELPEGWAAGPIQWPMPEVHLDKEADLLAYSYSNEVLLMVPITPPAQVAPGDVTLKAKLGWQVCQMTCIPGSGTYSLKLKAGNAAQPANNETFGKWRAQLPKESAPFPVEWNLTNPKEIKVKFGELPKEAKVEFLPLPPEGVIPDHPKMEGPDAAGGRTVTIPLPSPAEGAWRALITVQNGNHPREGWIVSAKDSAPAGNAAAAPAAPQAKPSDAAAPAAPKADTGDTVAKQPISLLYALLIAFLGGLVLNVMPCVLPVIALKVFGFVHQAGHDPTRVRKLGLAFVGGVFVYFLALAVAVAILGRAFRWGFQLQNPYMLAGLVALVFIFGLNLLGVFEITLSSEATSKLSDLSSKEGYKGAFMHGLFTTLLGTSCTAPFLAPALGFATTQSTPVIFLLFIAMAAGLSLPYFLLTSNPALLKFLPKPGPWMERFKQAMGFIMLAVAVWLFTVFAARGEDASTALSWYLFVLAVAAWLFGVISRRLVGGAIALVLAVGGYYYFLYGKLEAAPVTTVSPSSLASAEVVKKEWQPFSEERLEAARKEGRPVFVDFTASWCLNCKVFERTVLNSDVVKKAFGDAGVVTLKADWTNEDPTITKWLNKFDRVGVPLYLLYRPGEENPVVQDALTRQGVLDELGRKPGAVTKK